jgi:AcrR family transcriptional regulator
VTMAAVATQAGVSRVTVYAHFATAEALLEADWMRELMGAYY